MGKGFALVLMVLITFFASSGFANAKVTGLCANCHTMHNSQNGSAVARTGSGMGWNGSGQLTGGSIQGPQADLLVTDCVGCHSSTTNQTIINVGSSRVPIVFNTVEPAYVNPGPTNALAGGNFYWVKNVNDNRGHNVYGISAQDGRLSDAPGRNQAGPCMVGCHVTLANPPQGNTTFSRGGCQGCHLRPSHHHDNGIYRFLTGMNYDANNWGYATWVGNYGYQDYIKGTEDPDWEQTNSSTKHNYYQGTTTAYAGFGHSTENHSITAFCTGCHGDFHDVIGTSSLWIRHPVEISLPQTDEYNGYDPVNNYSVEAPVAWVDPANPARSGAVVMCLSCHRAHGSPYPSMLRWDYNTMVAGGGGSGGCFTCHTQKK